LLKTLAVGKPTITQYISKVNLIKVPLEFMGWSKVVYSFTVLSLVFFESGITPGDSLILYSSAVKGEYP
jgi:hypothetical protein